MRGIEAPGKFTAPLLLRGLMLPSIDLGLRRLTIPGPKVRPICGANLLQLKPQPVGQHRGDRHAPAQGRLEMPGQNRAPRILVQLRIA